jgi:hypothetical protein
MKTNNSIQKTVQERTKSFNFYSCFATITFCLLINLPGNITSFLIIMSLLFGVIIGFVATSDHLQSIMKMVKATFAIIFLVFSFSSNAQVKEVKTVMIKPGEVVSEGDTLQLGKGMLGKVYAHITYKYTGVPSIMVKRKGPLSTEYDGNVVFVSKVDQDKGVLTLTGIHYYKLECNAVKAFKDGEIKKFKRSN